MNRPTQSEVKAAQQMIGDAIYDMVAKIKEAEMVSGISIPDIEVKGPEWSIKIMRNSNKGHDPKEPIGVFE